MKDAQESGALRFIRRAPQEKNMIVPHLLGAQNYCPKPCVCSVTRLVTQRTYNRLDSRFVCSEGFLL